ncbi:hypothetical protein H206_00216 [Candidatus Electrothrix aarhusensis]|uniref:Uncharacterized protein n=1 Tax=Candidatus Electrothrix aarhusensis TaxID=1859131 RepID=A0A3S3RSJ5_9BACT|nr:hypothetical protein H206_00216 [Candidatus Electrothrix aarhusensis]
MGEMHKKKAGLPLLIYKVTGHLYETRRLSVPASQQVWLYLYTILKINGHPVGMLSPDNDRCKQFF